MTGEATDGAPFTASITAPPEGGPPVADILTSLPVGDIGLAGLVTITILALLTGKIVPRRQVDDIIADRDSYRAALERSEESRRMLVEQLDHTLEFTKTVDHLLRSLPHPTDRRDTPA